MIGISISPFLFGPLSNFIQTYGPPWATIKISRVHHLGFWLLSFVWAIYFGIWVGQSSWTWFSSGNLKQKIVLILVLAALLRLAVIIFGVAPLSSDAKEYDQLAQTLAATGTFQENGKLTAYRPIGYPAFLAGIYKIFGHSTFSPKFANVLLGIFSLLLLWRTFALWKDEETALKAVAMAAFYPPTLYTTQNILSEHLFGFLWILGIYFWEKGRKYKTFSFVSGLTMGISALVRPVVLAWGIIPILMSVAKKRWVSLVLFLMGVIIATGFWYHRNHKNFGVWTLSTNSGINFWMRADPQSTGRYHSPDSMRLDFPEEGKMEQKSRQFGWRVIGKRPWEYLRRGLTEEIKVFGFDYTYVLQGLTATPSYGQLVWGMLGQAFWWILFFSATLNTLTSLLSPQKNRKIAIVFPVATILCWAATHFFFMGVDRFHHPVVPFFAFLAVLTFKPSNKTSFEEPS